jgi:hypothetical protein
MSEVSRLWKSYLRVGSISLENLATQAISLIILGELAQRSFTHPFLVKIRYPEYFQVKCYNGISMRLRTCSVNVAKYHPAFFDGVARIHKF